MLYSRKSQHGDLTGVGKVSTAGDVGVDPTAPGRKWEKAGNRPWGLETSPACSAWASKTEPHAEVTETHH